MKSTRSYGKIALSGLFALLVCFPVWALEPKEVPFFQVETIEQMLVSSGDLPLSGRQLLVYIRPHCVSCEDLLHLLKKDEFSTVSERLIIIVGGRPSKAKSEILRFPDLVDASWYIDSYREAFEALELNGVPVVMGIRDGVIDWRINGVMANNQEQKAMIQSWHAQE